MKKILFLSAIMLVFLASCTPPISEIDTKDWSDLSNTEQIMFNASVYDSTIVKEAIIIEDKVIIFDQQSNEFIEIINYPEPVIVIALAFIVLLGIALLVMTVVGISSD